MRRGQAEKRPPFQRSDILTVAVVGVASFVICGTLGISEAMAAVPAIAAATAAVAIAATVWAGLAWRRSRQNRIEREILESKRVQGEGEIRKEEAEFRRRLMADVSHEIRTPLTSILGFAAVLEEEVQTPQKQLVRLIRHSGDRLLETVNSVLEMARLESSEQTAHFETFDIVSEVAATATLFEPNFEAEGLAFQLYVPEGRSLFVHLDRKLFHRVLSNLLSNALKFTAQGGISVGIENDGSELRLCVRDTGIGISEAFLPRLFEPYTQEEGVQSAGRPGTGLGLAITRHLVEMMKGRLEVRSVKDEGSTFVAIFPHAVVPGDERGREAVVADAEHAYNGDV